MSNSVARSICCAQTVVSNQPFGQRLGAGLRLESQEVPRADPRRMSWAGQTNSTVSSPHFQSIHSPLEPQNDEDSPVLGSAAKRWYSECTQRKEPGLPLLLE